MHLDLLIGHLGIQALWSSHKVGWDQQIQNNWLKRGKNIHNLYFSLKSYYEKPLFCKNWLERTYKPHYFSPLDNETDLNREKYAIGIKIGP